MSLDSSLEDQVAPGAKMIRQQLSRVLNSPEFEATEAQQAFLRFIVEKALNGQTDEIKGYTVATQIFGRRADFDQATDPVVSIHANKLRRALERYYLLKGHCDPIRIDIPKGTYVPTFEKQSLAVANVDSADTRSTAGNVDAWPSVLILPFKNLTGDPAKDFLGIGVATELAVEVARFQEIKILFPMEEQTMSSSTAGCRFVLGGSIQESDSGIKITAHITDTKTGRQIWADTHRSHIEAQAIHRFQERVVHIIAARIAGEYGIIPKTMAIESRGKSPAALTTYEAILRFYEYDHTLTPDTFARALESLTHAATVEPDCGQVWSMLARMYTNIYSLDFPGFEKSLEKAVEYGERGVRINPDNQRALGTLALVRFFSNELPSALIETERALELNPNSLFVMDSLGYIMALSGEWERGTALIKKVMRLNPFYRPVVHYALWVDCLRRQDFDGAYLETMSLKGPKVFWYPLARAATLGMLGRTAEAETYFKKLLDLRPDFPAKYRMLIGHYIKFDYIVEYVISGLRIAGLNEAQR